jgi:putative tryptophan/tyrosine transport system substrate-binding protein
LPLLLFEIVNMIKWVRLIGALFLVQGCQSVNNAIPTVGFADAFEDNTIEQAKQGFLSALARNGFDEEKKTVHIIYRNAQGNIPVLTQIIQYFISQKVNLIAASPSLSTIAAIQNTKSIPVFMMVSATPTLMKLTDPSGAAPANLFGVADEQDYIDTSFSMINRLVKPRHSQLSVGMIYNQSEPQSVEALMRIKHLAEQLHINLVFLPVNSTMDVQLVTQSLLGKDIDAFFANPDNTVFASFETIIQACGKAKVPVFTSEAGLVARGAVAAYGADIYQWGYQAGEQAARFLKSKSLENIHWELVKLRRRVFNPLVARQFGIVIPGNFEPVN